MLLSALWRIARRLSGRTTNSGACPASTISWRLTWTSSSTPCGTRSVGNPAIQRSVNCDKTLVDDCKIRFVNLDTALGDNCEIRSVLPCDATSGDNCEIRSVNCYTTPGDNCIWYKVFWTLWNVVCELWHYVIRQLQYSTRAFGPRNGISIELRRIAR